MDQRIQTITTDTLTPLVRKALSNPTAEIRAWQIAEMEGGTGDAIGGTALYRVTGQTDQDISWSLVLKILYERPGENENTPYYWKREFELYRSGMLDQLPETGLTPPTIYGFAEFPDSCWVWMADIQVEEWIWTLEDYRLASRRLGRFNGAYLTGYPIPDYAWLAFNWHCRIAQALAPTFVRLDEYLEHPLVQRTLPLDEKETIMAIWGEVDRYCAGLATLPRTLCHNDAFRRNFFHREKDTILIDWALAGRGAIGEDLVTMVALPLYFDFPLSRAEDLDWAVFDGYLDGLRDAGWDGDSQLARLGYTCAMTLRGLAGVKQDIGFLMDESKHSGMRREFGQTIEDVADHFANVRRFRLLRMAGEARQLLALLT